MDTLASAARKFSAALDASSSYQDTDKAIRDTLSQLKASDDLRQIVQRHPAQALQLLDPSKHSIISAIALVHILEAQNTISQDDRSSVLDATANFLINFEPLQTRYVAKQLETILSLVGSNGLFSAHITIELLVHAILRIDPKGSTFTLSHLTLARLAYNEGEIEQSLPVLDRDITSFPLPGRAPSGPPLCDPDVPSSVFLSHNPALSTDMRPDHVLEYNFICGLAHTSRRDWAKAQAAFQRVITHPGKEKGISKISVDAFKRWILIGLLHEGHEATLPSYTSTAVKNACTSLAQPYISIAKLFSTTSAAQIKAEAEAGASIWTEDGTLSLVAEVISAYQKWRIINLHQVYSRVSLSQLASETASAETGESLKDLEAVLALVQKMVDAGMLKGDLHTDGSGATFLTFQSDQTLLTEQDFSREIARSHKSIQALGTEYKSVSERLAGNKDYVKHMAREQKRLEKEAENPQGIFESQIEDEDLMTGIVVNG